MITVSSHQETVDESALDAAIARLQHEPGAWVGCEVALDPLFRREGSVFVDCVLRVEIRGRTVRADPLDRTGAALLARLAPALGLAPAGDGAERTLAATAEAPGEAIRWLRAWLGAFRGDDGFAQAAAFAYDHFRFADPAPPPDDGELRTVLFVPGTIVARHADGRVTRTRFAFDGEPAQPGPRRPLVLEPGTLRAGDDFGAGEYARALERAIGHLRAGECESLTMSQCFRRPTATRYEQAVAQLRATSPMPAMYAFQLAPQDWLFGASPDIQARLRGDRLECLPVCGTLPRGETPAADDVNFHELLHSPVDAASLAVEVEGFRADMSGLCRPDTVRVVEARRVHRFARLIHGVACLEGRLRPSLDALDVLLATAAPSMLVGLPRARAIELLPRLEGSPRGFYAGVAARLGADGSLDAHAILRGVRLARGIAEIRTGGTLIAASQPAREETESRFKARALLATVGASLEKL
jgi:anthranilate/para-aminobenzoate synthase component I